MNPNIYAVENQTLTISSNSSSKKMNPNLKRRNSLKENYPLRLPRRNMIHSRCSNLKKMLQQFL